MAPVQTLILDAGPLITQPALVLMKLGDEIYTTPGVRGELRDEQVQRQLIIWGDRLKVRQPKPESIHRVTAFAKQTGDSTVLSLNDIHIIALAYELDVEAHGGDDSHIRSHPTEPKAGHIIQQTPPQQEQQQEQAQLTETTTERQLEPVAEASTAGEPATEEPIEDDDGFQVVTKKTRNRRHHRKHQPQPEPQPEPEPEPVVEEIQADEVLEHVEHQDDAGEVDFDDDEGWITPDNINQEMLKDAADVVEDAAPAEPLKCALATGDFACQNVAIQMGLTLMNYSTGKQIHRVKNFMYRCHACFKLTPIPKDGTPKHFCPKCGGATLMRCTVLVDLETGKITPHLKRNFVYIRRGERYSMPSPLLKMSQKKAGQRGFQHNEASRHRAEGEPLLLREDQKEYQQALKHNEWERRQQEKAMQQWIGGGSADNYISPFALTHTRNQGVRVGRGRHLNAKKRK